VILVDANLLLYAKLSSFPQHEAARAWLDGRLSGTARVGLPWESLLAFLRLSTSPALFPRPLAMEAAWGQVREWLAQPCVFCPGPTEAHEATLDEIIGAHAITPRLVGDAHLAAIALEHGLVLCSADEDFARFDKLRWINPLAGA
jgi:toxin-antitoxin system PIN domain toxin